jgi:hypothetical protein
MSLVFVAGQLSAFAFEGKVNLTMTVEGGDTMAVTYALKGPKVRTELRAQGQQFASVTDTAKHETILFAPPPQRAYSVWPVDHKSAGVVPGHEMTSANITTTGKTEVILGHKCEELLIKHTHGTTELWLAGDLGVFVGMGQGSAIPMGAGFDGQKPMEGHIWEELLRNRGGFPLRVISRNQAKKQVFKLEATKIEPGSLPDSLFTVPAGYTKSDNLNRVEKVKATIRVDPNRK